MSRSEDWWRAAKELADLIMADRDEMSWTLAWAPKSVTVIKPDGTPGHRQIRAVLGRNSNNFIECQPKAQNVGRGGSQIVSQESIQETRTTSTSFSRNSPIRYKFFTHGLQDVDEIPSGARPSVFIGSYHTMCSPLDRT